MESGGIENRGKFKARGILGALGAFLRAYGGIWWQILANLGRRLAKLGQSWRQVATKMGHDIFKMDHDSGKTAILESTRELLVWFWEHFWLNERHRKVLCFLDFFLALLGCLLWGG